MLQALTIRQIALIEEAHIEFGKGLQVLTGETGAGKSIVVDSVNLILGGRADREMIRSGSDHASVEAVFDISENENAKAFLEMEQIEYDPASMIIYREISTFGKNTCRICGILIPLSKLKTFAGTLMDLHGQSEHQYLSDPEMHLSYLDQTGGKEHKALIRKVEKSCESFLENHRSYAKLVKKNENREERIEILEKDLELLRKAHIQKGEESALTARRKNVEKEKQKLISSTGSVISCQEKMMADPASGR